MHCQGDQWFLARSALPILMPPDDGFMRAYGAWAGKLGADCANICGIGFLFADATILNIITSERLALRWLTPDDAPFILELLTNPSWLQYIGDKGLKTVEDARAYIVNGPMAMYEKHGFGLYLVQRTQDGAPLGLCGLIKRDGLHDVDIGYGFMPRYWGQGYALESSLAVLEYGRTTLGITRVVAITSDDNQASVRLLEKLGLRHTANVRLSDIAPELMLFTPQDAICN